MISINNLFMRGRVSLTSRLLGGVVMPPDTAPPYPVEPPMPTLAAARNDEPDVPGCTVSDFSHETMSVRTNFQPSISYLMSQYGAAPGSRWSVQWSRWTAPANAADIHEYYTEPGEAIFYVGDTVVPFSGMIEDFQTYIGELVTAINTVPGWFASLIYDASDVILLVAYRAGVQKTGLRIAYPDDRLGQTQPHPAVELLFNGNWNHGAPKNGGCVPLTDGDYTPKFITFPGQWSFEETGFRGSFGEVSSTASTIGANPDLSGPSNPALVSQNTYVLTTPMSALGFSTEDNYFYLNIYDGEGEHSGVSYDYTVGDTIADFINALNSEGQFHGFNARLDDAGHLVIVNMNPGVAPGLASFAVDPQDPNYGDRITNVFGANPTSETYRTYTFLTSSNRFELATPLAQFGALEYGFIQDYTTTTVSLGSPTTIGGLISAVNALDGGATALAYLEAGRLVVAVKDSSNDPDEILRARPIGSGADAWRQPGELLFGAASIRMGILPYRYDDNLVTVGTTGAITRSTFAGSTVPVRPAYATVTPEPVTLGDRKLYLSTALSTLYPVGTLIAPSSMYEDQLSSAIEVSPYNTIRDLFNHINPAILGSTLRFVAADGTHEATEGFLRLTGPSYVKLRWYNPVTKVAGDATRFFHDDGNDGAQVGVN